MNDVNTIINKPLLLIMAVCMLCMGCKKQLCYNVVCGEGFDCVNETCLCKEGRIGENCQIDIARYSGRYHFTGTWSSWHYLSPPYGSQGTTDDTSEVVFIADTLFTRSKKFLYTKYISGQDTTRYHLFALIPPYSSNYIHGRIKLSKVSPDTLWFISSEGSPGGGVQYNLIATKVP